MAQTPAVSMIIPCRNEERHIAACLECALASEYPHEKFEVVVADGRSSDGTRSILAEYAKRDARIHVIDNPQKSTPMGLNAALRSSSGEVVLLMGAHTTFPPNYVSDLVEALYEFNADVTGGVCKTLPADGRAQSRAIALAMSHPFGVGNSHFRTGTSKARWVDTVAFGCYRREVFQKVGEFDTELPRNQDDELNLRLLKAGGRMLLIPTVQSAYVARDSIRRLWRMYYQYGYYKPLVARKVGGILTLRQIVPTSFVVSVGLLLALSPWFALSRQLVTLEIAAYLLLALAVILTMIRSAGIVVGLYLLPVFLTLHMAYGIGFLRGWVRFNVQRARAQPTVDVPLSR